jgi:serine protease Do
MPVGKVLRSRRWLHAALIVATVVSVAQAETIDSSVQRHLREATFEVVVAKPDTDPLTYEKPLPLELLPYAERTGKYRSVGTAFAIGHGRFVTAAHVINVGMNAAKGALAVRDQSGKIFKVDRVLAYSATEDYAVFTLLEPPRVTALDTHDRPALNDPVFAVGNAYGEGIVIRDGLYTSDTPEDRDGRWKWIRFSAAASPGNSGGPLVDRKGRVIGVVLRKSPNENLNVAVAIEQVLKASEERATLDSRATYRFPLMRASDTSDNPKHFSLPKPIDEFYAALKDTFKQTADTVRAQYQSSHGDRMFPHGADSLELLNTFFNAAFPRAIEERSDGVWGVSEPKPQRSQLEQNGFVESAAMPAATLVRLRKPDDVKWAQLYPNSKEFMDLVLKGVTINRVIGTESVRVTSLGSAELDTTYKDSYGRTWQVRAWSLPFSDSMVVMLALPTPQGYVALMAQRPVWLQDIELDDLRSYTGFFYVSFIGTLKQWQDYLAASLAQPDAVRALDIQSDYGKMFRLHSKRFNLNYSSEVPKVDPESMLWVKFSYFSEGGATVWDVAGIDLLDPEQKGNWLAVIRHTRPPASLPEGFTDRWRTIETGSHPFNGTAYSINGGTRIDAIQDLKQVSAEHRSVAYSFTVTREGNQDSAVMKHALEAIQRGLSVAEH